MKKRNNGFVYVFIVLFFIMFNVMVISNNIISKYGEFNIKRILFIVFFVFIEILFLLLIDKIKNKKIETKFVVLFIPIGLMYLFAFPMNQTPDEGAHVFRAYEISMGHLVSTIKDNRFVGRKLPKNVPSTLGNDSYYKLFNNLDKKSDKDKEFVVFDNTALYSFVCYIPQALGIFISRIFTDRILVQLYVGRIFNFLTFVFLMYLSIKFIPIKKEFILFLGLLPMTLQEAISLAPDSLTISASIFLFSYIMYLKEKNGLITKKELLILSLFCLVISQCKIVYLPICLLLNLLPDNKFGSKKNKYLIIFSIAILVVVLNLVWLKLASAFLSVSSGGKSTKQIVYILSNPLNYLMICGSTFNKNINSWIYQSLGKTLGWVNIFTPDIYILISLIIMFVLIVSYEKYKINVKDKLLLIFIFMSTVVLIFTSLYVQWTDYKADGISGIQGRYFLPLFILLPFIFLNNNFNVKKEKLSKYFYSFMVFENVLVIFIIILSYI